MRKPSAAVVISVALLASAPAALAASGAIAFSDAGGSLYVASEQGTNAKTLFRSDDSTSVQALDVSPDGAQVLALQLGDRERLLLVPADGDAPAPVAGTEGADSGSFSPDGTQISFSVSQFSSGALAAGLYTVSAAGGTPKQILASLGGEVDSVPQYSPDGRTIAFTHDAVGDKGDDTVTLELMPASGGAPNALATGLVPDLSGGGRLSFSPDGTTIAFAGDYTDPGIYTVPAAGGATTRITSDLDYWPAFSADGSKLFFSRDASSDHADDNIAHPVAPTAEDVYELWTVRRDGSGESVVAEGDFESLALGAAAAAAQGSAAAAAAGSASTKPAAGKTAAKARPAATAVRVAIRGSRYVVTWRGKAAAWKLTLKVGGRTATTRVKGSIHSHTFVLHGARGAASAQVRAV